MPSANITALTNYAGGQAPADLVYIGKSPFGATDDRKSTLNDLLSIITKNITDGALRFEQFAAPALSAANAGAIYFDNVSKTFQVSENGGAYVGLITLAAGSANEIQYNGGAGAFAANAAYTYDSTTNTVNIGAAGLTGKLKLTHTNTRALTIQPGVQSAARTFTWMSGYGNANQAVITDGFGNLSYGDFISYPLPGVDKEILFNDAGSLGADSGLTYDKVTKVLTLTIPISTGGLEIYRTINSALGVITSNEYNGYNYDVGALSNRSQYNTSAHLYGNAGTIFRHSVNYAYAELANTSTTVSTYYADIYIYGGSHGDVSTNRSYYYQDGGNINLLKGLDLDFQFYSGTVADFKAISIGGVLAVSPTSGYSIYSNLDLPSYFKGRIDLAPIAAGAGNTNELRFLELAANGTNYAAFKAADSLAASVTWTLPSADGSSGQFLQTNGSGALSFATASAALTAGQVGFGSAGNVLTGSTKMIWDDSTRIFSFVTGASNAQIYFNTSLSTANIKFQSSAGIPGSQAGLIFPYIGGDQTSGHGLWWSDGTYLNTSRLNLQLGFNFQGAASSTSPVKIRKATGTSADGNIIFAFFPDSGFFDLQPYGVSAGETARVRFSELAANGTHYIEFRAPDALTASVTLAWPDGAGSAGQVLTTNGSNALSWTLRSAAYAYTAKTTTYVITTSDYVIDCTSGTFTVTLPPVSGLTGQAFIVKNSGVGVITLDGDGSETIDGSTTQAIAAGISMTVMCTGAAWIIV